MARSSGKGKRSGNASKIQALLRAQQINEILKRSTIASAALQSGGDDRPVGEQHISDLLEEDQSERRLEKTVSRTIIPRRMRAASKRPRISASKSKRGKKRSARRR